MRRGAHFDTSEIDRLAADLSAAPGRLQRRGAKVMLVAANKIKKNMREDIRQGLSNHRTHLPQLPYKVSYDHLDRLGLEYEIGIDKGGQGDLGNVAAYGTSNNAPIFDPSSSLRREMPHIIRNLSDDAEQSVLD